MNNNSKVKTRGKGTMNYLAPEILQTTEVTASNQILSFISTKVDVWAFGALTSFIFSGVIPWLNKYKDNPIIIQKVIYSKKEFPIPDNITNSDIINIIRSCMVINPQERPSMNEVDNLVQKL